MCAPLHINFHDNKKREKFNKALQNIISFHQNMSVMKMVKNFQYHDTFLFLKDANRFTVDGLLKYWSSVDSAVEHWVKFLVPTGLRIEQPQRQQAAHFNCKPPQQKFFKKLRMEYRLGGTDKFKWNRNKEALGRAMPKPLQ